MLTIPTNIVCEFCQSTLEYEDRPGRCSQCGAIKPDANQHNLIEVTTHQDKRQRFVQGMLRRSAERHHPDTRDPDKAE